MDGCNPQRTFTLGAAYVPYFDKQSLNLNWTFSSKNYTTFININNNNTNNNNTNNNDFENFINDNNKYLGCSTNVENGASNAISCLFKNRGLYTLNKKGQFLWSYQDAIVSSEISNISSVPLLLPYNTTIIDTGLEIMAFQNGIFLWEEIVSNLSNPTNSLSKWSAGFVDPQYFSITLGDGRISLYDYSLGMCWASLLLTYKNEQYLPIAVTSSIYENIYIIATTKNQMFNQSKCAIFAFKIGDVTYRLQTRWVHQYECNEKIGYLGLSVIKYINQSSNSSFPISNLIYYSINNNNTNTNQIALSSIRDESQFKSSFLWQINVNKYCGMGFLIDPHEIEYGLNGIWICDYKQNNTLLLKQINVTNGNLISDININEIVFNVFSVSDDWISIIYTNINSRGSSGFTSDLNHYVIVLCVNIKYINKQNNAQTTNLLIIVDIDKKYLLSWYKFENELKCIGQISATTDGKLIVPLSDGMTVVALSA